MPHLNEPVAEHVRKEYISVRNDLTVEQALAEARNAARGSRFLYFYVNDQAGKLVGVLSTRSLLLSEPTAKISEIIDSRIVTLPSSASLMDACEFFLLHRYLALPVVDDQGCMVGVIDVEVYADEMNELAAQQIHEDEEDFFQLIGVRLAEVRKANYGTTFAYRFPWLLCNVLGGLAAAVVAGWFSEVLEKAIALAMFIPIVLALAESVSIQSLTLTLQSLHSGTRTTFAKTVRAMVRELPIGLMLGLGSAVIVAIVAGVWLQQIAIVVCLLLSILITVSIAALYGVWVPYALHSFRHDPKIAAGPITLTLTDLTALTVYLCLGSLLF